MKFEGWVTIMTEINDQWPSGDYSWEETACHVTLSAAFHRLTKPPQNDFLTTDKVPRTLPKHFLCNIGYHNLLPSFWKNEDLWDHLVICLSLGVSISLYIPHNFLGFEVYGITLFSVYVPHCLIIADCQKLGIYGWKGLHWHNIHTTFQEDWLGS
jgi:hypothetical protein